MSDRHDLIIATAERGDLDHACALALAVDSPRYRDLAFADIARIADAAGSLERAEDALSRILDPHVRSLVQSELLGNAAARHDFERAERIARAAPEPHVRTGLLLAVIRALAAAGRRDRALALADELRRAAHDQRDPLDRDWASLDAVMAAIAADDLHGALRTAEAIGSPVVRVGALAEIAKAADDPALAARLLDQATALARSLPSRADRATALLSVLRAHPAPPDQAPPRPHSPKALTGS
ncbi:hypothetical protein DZF91_17120 [Actinomadura logoneensis]|uniref:Tetratricopeptide repeat protein n=1 Tax=Actinomadura logoneensis TaxID=2293572 RepID=A0A372JKW0_9ACTN|nr:hypothetical protein [Actinomadura logoneensis]RFU40436.1 hypothetical protein DZF91_17120 [Actinomadura logoneensis]